MQTDKEIPINIDFISAAAKREVNKGILNSSLKILESGGYLKLLSEFDKKTSLQFNIGINNLREFIKKTSNKRIKELTFFLLRDYGSSLFTQPVHISADDLSLHTDLSESELDDCLSLLDNLGILSYNKMSAKESVLLLQPRVNANRLNLDYKKINETYIYLQKKLDTIIDYVYSNECRFKFILKYFGEETKDYKCGKCDKCTINEKLPEATVDYLKEVILRTLYQSLNGINETTLFRIIKGTGKREIYLKWNTFGICGNYEKNDLVIVLHEMISENLIKRNKRSKKIIELTNEGYQKLKELGLTQEPAAEDLDYEKNLELFNLLREARKNASMKFMQTASLICPDQILKEIAGLKPKTKNELLSIKGFNLRMFNKLGNEFLEIINNFLVLTGTNGETAANTKKTMPENINETHKLLTKGYLLKDIASLRKLSEPVISMQIETILQYDPEINVSFLFPQGTYDKIIAEIKKGYTNLKDLKNRLTEDIGYPLIRIAAAKYKASLKQQRFIPETVFLESQDKL
jgi:ATP-dependent DNA helicase RecQ